jgi:hypothetical protein
MTLCLPGLICSSANLDRNSALGDVYEVESLGRFKMKKGGGY